MKDETTGGYYVVFLSHHPYGNHLRGSATRRWHYDINEPTMKKCFNFWC